MAFYEKEIDGWKIQLIESLSELVNITKMKSRMKL